MKHHSDAEDAALLLLDKSQKIEMVDRKWIANIIYQQMLRLQATEQEIKRAGQRRDNLV